MQQEEIIPIPKDRVNVMLAAKRNLARLGKSTIKVDSLAKEVIITSDDPVNAWRTSSAVEAVARGFSPDAAKKLFNEEYVFDQIHIKEFARSKNRLIELRGRVIGKQGKARRKFEKLTGTDLRVYGKTIGIIGKHENVVLCKRYLERLLHGSPHSNIFQTLEAQRALKE